MKHFEQYSDSIGRMYPELAEECRKNAIKLGQPHAGLSKNLTFQVTDKCNLACTYCYQINKGTRVMTFETAKKLIDMIIADDPKLNGYISPKTSPSITIEFIGGEPFLQAELIEKICDYFEEQLIMNMHPWATRHRYSICSNGTLYFDEKVQHFLKRYKDLLSFSVTIDGNKELHDSCRVFPDGSPSYDLAIAAAKDWIGGGDYMGSKITISPDNLEYMNDAIKHMVSLGYDEINANTVYEEGWNVDHARIFYKKLKEIADYWNDNKLVDSHYLSLFVQEFFQPKEETDIDTWCGGGGSMLSMDPDGYLYPCIRYMESSLGSDREPLRIGHVDYGIAQKQCEKDCLHCLNSVTRRTENTDECFYCPIAAGCSNCLAYDYQVNGTADKRAIFICVMHKARALANVYFWNRYYRENNIKKRFKCWVPKEWALEIIDEAEWNMLLELSSGDDCELVNAFANYNPPEELVLYQQFNNVMKSQT